MNSLYFLSIYFSINAFSYALMWRDKAAARRSARRTPEKMLFLAAFAMGGLGIFLGTRAPLYHKRGKRKFMRLAKIILFGNFIFITALIFYFIF